MKVVTCTGDREILYLPMRLLDNLEEFSPSVNRLPTSAKK